MQIIKRSIAIFCLVVVLAGGFNSAALAQTSSPALQSLTDRIELLKTYVDRSNWTTIKTFIHGPLGQIRVDIGRAIDKLPSKQQAAAKNLAKDLFNDLVKLDIAATDREVDRTDAAYSQVRQDFTELLALLPK